MTAQYLGTQDPWDVRLWLSWVGAEDEPLSNAVVSVTLGVDISSTLLRSCGLRGECEEGDLVDANGMEETRWNEQEDPPFEAVDLVGVT